MIANDVLRFFLYFAFLSYFYFFYFFLNGDICKYVSTLRMKLDIEGYIKLSILSCIRYGSRKNRFLRILHTRGAPGFGNVGIDWALYSYSDDLFFSLFFSFLAFIFISICESCWISLAWHVASHWAGMCIGVSSSRCNVYGRCPSSYKESHSAKAILCSVSDRA